MKHETFDERSLLDLSKPSLEALSWTLRNPQTWPADFTWNYGICWQCAVGLAHELWGVFEKCRATEWRYDAAKYFDMPIKKSVAIFYRTIRTGVTPEMVADDIDAYLASRK